MEQVSLAAEKRTILGKKVKNLRKQGILPAHVFGHKVKTEHVQVKAHDFNKVFEQVGETGIINLSFDKENRPVMVRNIQIHPVTDDPLHIDFYQVNLTEKVTVNIPLEIISEAPAVEKKVGLLLTPVTEIEVEALPTDLPESIEVDVSNLANIDDAIKVQDLKIDNTKIEVKADPELVVAQIGELVTKEMEAVEAEAEAEAAAAAEEQQAEAPEEGKAEGEETAEAAEGAAGGEEGQEKAEGADEQNPPTAAEAPKEEKKD